MKYWQFWVFLVLLMDYRELSMACGSLITAIMSRLFKETQVKKMNHLGYLLTIIIDISAAHYELKHAYGEKLYNSPAYEKYEYTEKEADNLAVKTLCNNGHCNIVNLLADHCDHVSPTMGSHCYNSQESLNQWKTQRAKELNDTKDLLYAMAK